MNSLLEDIDDSHHLPARRSFRSSERGLAAHPTHHTYVTRATCHTTAPLVDATSIITLNATHALKFACRCCCDCPAFSLAQPAGTPPPWVCHCKSCRYGCGRPGSLVRSRRGAQGGDAGGGAAPAAQEVRPPAVLQADADLALHPPLSVAPPHAPPAPGGAACDCARV